VIVGLGNEEELAKSDYVRLGGVIASILGAASAASILMEGPSKWRADAEAAADIALGLRLRHYRFDKYKAKKREAGDGDKADASLSVTIHVEDPVAAKRSFRSRDAVGSGVVLARDLVNEPPNVLDPVEFAKRAKELEKLGVEITILDEKQLAKIGMRALLGVGQGSEKESRVVIMRWNGAKAKKGAKAQPVRAAPAKAFAVAAKSSHGSEICQSAMKPSFGLIFTTSPPTCRKPTARESASNSALYAATTVQSTPEAPSPLF
jgi:leucyl aminopeptidase